MMTGNTAIHIASQLQSGAPRKAAFLVAVPFIINSGNFVLINKGITLRGAGPGQTTLAKTNGAKPFPQPGEKSNPHS